MREIIPEVFNGHEENTIVFVDKQGFVFGGGS
jgi:hypothetical protein